MCRIVSALLLFATAAYPATVMQAPTDVALANAMLGEGTGAVKGSALIFALAVGVVALASPSRVRR